jgi:hypothetical protein
MLDVWQFAVVGSFEFQTHRVTNKEIQTNPPGNVASRKASVI